MKKNKSGLFAMLVTGIFFSSSVGAQESANASGGDATGSGGTAAYSIGQLVYTANLGNGGNVAQGVQYAFEIFTVGVKETALNISPEVFPNPTADKLILQICNYNIDKLDYTLYDMHGKLISKEQINNIQTQIEMNYLPASSYILNITDQKNKKVKSFKIIKTN